MSVHSSRTLKLATRLGVGLVALVAALVALAGIPAAQAATVSGIQNVSRDGANSILPRVAEDPGGNIHVVWVSQEGGSNIVRYAKGVYNGSGYNFGGNVEIANVGGFGYATPNVGVAPNGTVAVAWSPNFSSTQLKVFSAGANPPGGASATLDLGIRTSISADANNRFHIASDRDSAIQYCEFDGSGCARRDTFPTGNSTRADVAVDSANNVHVVWDTGQVTRYRARPANGEWGGVQDLGGGNNAQIAPDGQGNVHIVWSGDFDIQYCRRTLGSGCLDRSTISAGDDVQPSVGATPGGRVVVVFRDGKAGRITYDARENGQWQGPRQITAGVQQDASARNYTDRTAIVFSLDFDIQATVITAGAPGGTPPGPPPAPQPTSTPRPSNPAPTPVPPTPTPTPINAPVTGSFGFATTAFQDLWTRTDSLVRQNAVTYSWIWGPSAFTAGVSEYYVQSPGQVRTVQYFDKSRMEINQPSAPRGPYYVTNGRLADELITGLLQTGDAQYEQRAPAAVAVAGDPQNTFPLYRDLQSVYRKTRASDRADQMLYRAANGQIETQPAAGASTDPQMVITQRVAGLGIPRIFWDFMNRPGRVVENGRTVDANPLYDWRYVIGEPLTEAYWTYVKVNGRDAGVLVQAFERRVLTYTPVNPAGFEVEMGNIGRHYFEWRYGVRPR